MKKIRIFIGAYKEARADGKSISESLERARLTLRVYGVGKGLSKLLK